MKDYFPIYVCLRHKKCLIVGGGKVAERKIKKIFPFAPDITVIAPFATDKIAAFAKNNKIKWLPRKFKNNDVSKCFLVFAATDDEELNRKIADICNKKNIMVNVAKPGSSGSFIVPAVVAGKDISIAVSTSGQSPATARLLKVEIKRMIGPYTKLLSVINPLRASLLTENSNSNYNKTLWNKFFRHPVLDMVRKGELEQVRKLAEEIFCNHKTGER